MIDTLTTRAVLQHGYGSAEVLGTGEVARPAPGPGEVLVRVHAAGLDRGAWHFMTGRPYALRLATGLRSPRQPVLGTEVAGTVLEVGAGVDRFGVGDDVYGFGTGTFAEHAVARVERLAALPPGLSFEQAAVVPVSGATALQALVDVGRVRPGQRVLVIGASGGVGTYAVQLAVALGARVTGVAGTAKLDLVRSLGAERVVDHTSTDFADEVADFDLVLDVGGSPSLARLRRVLVPGGTAVIVGGEGGGSWTGMGRQLRALAISPFVSQRLTFFLARQRAADLQVLSDHLTGGSLVPVVDSVIGLDGVADAMRRLEAGLVRGKVAVTP